MLVTNELDTLAGAGVHEERAVRLSSHRFRSPAEAHAGSRLNSPKHKLF
jgi:hypothetical protein